MSNATTILLVTPQLSIGGAENQVVILAIELKKMGWETIVVSSGGENENELNRANITHIKAPVDKKNVGAFFKSLLILSKTINKYHVSVIHCHAVIPTILSRIAICGQKIPLVNTGHGWPDSKLPTVVNLLKRTTDHQIAISKDMQKYFIKFGFPSKKISVIYNSIMISDFKVKRNDMIRQELGAQPNQILLGIAARLNETSKGHSILFQVFKDLHEDFPNLRLAVIGDGPLKTEFEAEVQRLRINNFVRFTGNRKDMPDIYASLDFLVHPSLREGLPVVVLEAMAASKPVIATSVNGTPEVVINGITGLLIPPKNSVALANAIRELICDKNKAVLMGFEGEKIVKEKFSSTIMAQEVSNLYIKLLK